MDKKNNNFTDNLCFILQVSELLPIDVTVKQLVSPETYCKVGSVSVQV